MRRQGEAPHFDLIIRNVARAKRLWNPQQPEASERVLKYIAGICNSEANGTTTDEALVEFGSAVQDEPVA